jgi:hypothetical protein
MQRNLPVIRHLISVFTICLVIAGFVYYKVAIIPKRTLERLEANINMKIEKNLSPVDIRSQIPEDQQQLLSQLKQKHECRLHWLTSVLAVLQQHKTVLTPGFKDCLRSDIYTDKEKESLQIALAQFHDGAQEVYVGNECLKPDVPSLINLASQENKKISIVSAMMAPPPAEPMMSFAPPSKSEFIKKLREPYLIESMQLCPREVVRSALLSYIDKKFIIAPGSTGCFDPKGPRADFIQQAREFVFAASKRKPAAKLGDQNIEISESNLLRLSGFQDIDAKK